MLTNSFFTIAFVLFLSIDALGVIPVYLSMVEQFTTKKKFQIALQELFFALIIMILFHFLGMRLLNLLNLTSTTIQIAGGIVIFLIAIRLVFPPEGGEVKPVHWKKTRPPLVFPIATPLMAGPQVLAIIMIYSQEEKSNLIVIGAIIAAWIVSSILFLLASPIYKIVGEKGLNAIQRLMGLMVALIAIQMLLNGLKGIKL